jgi:N-acetylglucosaminyldiphosphoundecaprenol N-acetyl-beta-D-mannosaminyltransferase
MATEIILPTAGEGKREKESATPSYRVLGVRFDAVQIPDVVARMEEWIAKKEHAHYVAISNVHVVMEARHSVAFRNVLDSADLCVPDGMPLVWVGRMRGHNLAHRVYGPDLFMSFCRETQSKGYRHFFYGGAPGVPEALAAKLREQFPMLEVAGTYSPPFRPLTAEEDDEVVEMIHRANADVLWVGLGCPKQELWMHEHRERLRVPVLLGVGQAFDIHAGRLRQAPRWMQERGMEWLFRLAAEPRRLWRRYLVYNSQFVVSELLEILGVAKFD